MSGREQVEEAVPAEHPATLDDVLIAHMALGDARAVVRSLREERDQLIRGAVENGVSMYAVAKAVDISQTMVAKIVRA